MPADFHSILDQARQLTAEEQAKLIDALWDSSPSHADVPLHPEWAAELERRIADICGGKSNSIPWHQIRDEALAKTGPL